MDSSDSFSDSCSISAPIVLDSLCDSEAYSKDIDEGTEKNLILALNYINMSLWKVMEKKNPKMKLWQKTKPILNLTLTV